MTLRALLSMLAVAATLPGQTRGYETVALTEKGQLTITVRWKGDLPAVEPFRLPDTFKDRHPEDAAVCQACIERGELRREDLLVDPKTRGIANVAVSFPRIRRGKAPLAAATLDNRGGRFQPHLSFVPAGRALTVTNSDGFVHNARIQRHGVATPLWNAILASGDQAKTRPLRVAGIYEIVCDVHPWMKAYFIASKNPYVAVTDARGEAKITDLPPGDDHTVAVWHETLGQTIQVVKISHGTTVVLELTQEAFKAR